MHNTIKYSIIPDIVSIVCVTFKEAIGLMECIEIIIRAEYGAHLMEDVWCQQKKSASHYRDIP